MLRLMMTGMVLLLGSTTVLAAERTGDLAAGGAILGARQQSTASIAKARPSLAALPAPRLRVADALAPAPSSIRGAAAGDDRSIRTAPSAPARALAQAVAPDLSRHLARLGAGGEQTTLAYALNDGLSLGLDYRLVTDESLGFKVAQTGAVDPDYASHSVLLRAHWQF